MYKTHTSLEGWFHLRIYNPSTDTTRELRFKNLITDAGLDKMGSTDSLANYIHLGTGSTAPAVSDTSLASFLAAASAGSFTGSIGGSGSTAYQVWKKTASFAQGAVAGNLTEIGTASTSAATPAVLFSRALLVDSDGSPTTITVLPIEQVTVSYELHCYQTSTDDVQTISTEGVPYTITTRPSYVGSSSGIHQYAPADRAVNSISGGTGSTPTSYPATSTLGAVTAIPSGSSSGSWSTEARAVMSAYVPGTLYRDCTWSGATGSGNATGGIGALRYVNTFGGWQVGFSPALPKDNTKTIVFTCRFSWGRHAP